MFPKRKKKSNTVEKNNLVIFFPSPPFLSLSRSARLQREEECRRTGLLSKVTSLEAEWRSASGDLFKIKVGLSAITNVTLSGGFNMDDTCFGSKIVSNIEFAS